MDPFSPKRLDPEEKILQDIVSLLKRRDWYVMRTHGNAYQSGFPDLYACKRSYGYRWIEVKNPKSYCFTAAQMECFPRLTAEGVYIWVLTGDSESEYNKLFQPANWWQYLSVNKPGTRT